MSETQTPRKATKDAQNAEQMRVERLGDGNPAYVHGENPSRRSLERFQSGQAECQMPGCEGRTFVYHQHHVVYKQHVKSAGGDLWDGDNALNLCAVCHGKHHAASMRVPLTSLRDQNIRFAFNLLGAAAYDYLTRRYSGTDSRLDRALVEFQEAGAAA